jgi:hypothetical protein
MRLVLILAGLAYLLVGGEVLYRFTDGYELTTLALTPRAFVDPANPELLARTAANPLHNGVDSYVWNDFYLQHAGPSMVSLLQQLKADDVFAFHSYDGSQYPRFRLYPNASFNMGVTNAFGWVSSDISVAKPKNTIRIGIIGDSTSHNPYGRYLQAYLTSWARGLSR